MNKLAFLPPLIAITVTACGGGSSGSPAEIETGTDLPDTFKQSADISGVLSGMLAKVVGTPTKNFVDRYSSLQKAESTCSGGGTIDVTEDETATFNTVRIVFSQCIEDAGEGLERLIEGVFTLADQDAEGTNKVLTFGEGNTPLSLNIRPTSDSSATESYVISVSGSNDRTLNEATGQFRSVLSIAGVFTDNVTGQSYSYGSEDFALNIQDGETTDSINIDGRFGALAGSAVETCEAVDAAIRTLVPLSASRTTGDVTSGQLELLVDQSTLTSAFSPSSYDVESEGQSETYDRTAVSQRCDAVSEALARLIIDFQ